MIIKIKRADGGISIMNLVDKKHLKSAIEKWKTLHAGEYVSHEEVAPEDVPTDRTFRNAWGHDLQVDMPKAQEIHMSRIREARDRKLEKLDVEQLKGRDVAAEKQALRDLPNTFDLTTATTTDELKALWPTELKE